ncbi:MAG: choice-of-anchor J domain-containing protein [Flavobacteriia bacterium]|nr:choice-of-anchor J domain-containing protein [Flavobacteriia bacterium]
MKKIIFSFSILTLLISSCKKEWDTPPINTIPEGKKIQSINTLINMHEGAPIKFTEDYSVYGVVTIDENNGNMYKNIFIQDKPSDVNNIDDSIRGINLRLLNSGGLYQGDYVRVNLKNCVLSTYNGVYQIDSVDVDKNIVKQETLINIEPKLLTIQELTENISKYSGRLIKIENVEFVDGPNGLTYSDAVGQSTQNRAIQDCSFYTLDVRTSGYSNFAALPLPTGNGSIIGVISVYNSDLQLYIRTPNEVLMTGIRCDGSTGVSYLNKNFEDNSITSGGWTNVNVNGTISWATNDIGSASGSYYAQCSNYVNSTNEACETWYISPSVDLSTSTNPIFTFLNAYKYDGDAMVVYVSTDYTSGNPSSATWTQLNPILSTGNFSWVTSGNVSLSAYKTNNVHIAFKYLGSSSSGSTWEIDDIIIKEN